MDYSLTSLGIIPRIYYLNAGPLHSVLQLNTCCNLQSSEVKAMAALLVGVYHLENMVLDAAVVHIENSKKVHVHVLWLRMLSLHFSGCDSSVSCTCLHVQSKFNVTCKKGTASS